MHYLFVEKDLPFSIFFLHEDQISKQSGKQICQAIVMLSKLKQLLSYLGGWWSKFLKQILDRSPITYRKEVYSQIVRCFRNGKRQNKRQSINSQHVESIFNAKIRTFESNDNHTASQGCMVCSGRWPAALFSSRLRSANRSDANSYSGSTVFQSICSQFHHFL